MISLILVTIRKEIFSFSRAPLLICFIADICFIVNTTSFRLPTILFALGHTLYAWNMFDNLRYVMYLILLLVAMISYNDMMALISLYTLIISSNIIYTTLVSNRIHVAGYWLFGLSDLLIYIRDFQGHWPWSNVILSVIILLLYFAGQYLLTL